MVKIGKENFVRKLSIRYIKRNNFEFIVWIIYFVKVVVLL